MSDHEKKPKTTSEDFVPVAPSVESKLNVKALASRDSREVWKTGDRPVTSLSKPPLRKYVVRKPVGKVVYLDPAKAFGKKEEVRLIFSPNVATPISAESSEESVFRGEKIFEPKKNIEVTPRYPSVRPVAMDWKKVYPAAEFDLDDIELTLNDGRAFRVDIADFNESFEGKIDKGEKPIIPDPDRVAELVTKKVKSADQIEVLGPERAKNEELSVPKAKFSKWAFWKRPSKRDQQLARISEGYLEMVDLVRSIRG